jgi:hypothetical protein
MNSEAVTLSQQGEAAGALIPRLRAVSSDDSDSNASRFDSGAFDLGDSATPPAQEQPGHTRIAPAAEQPHDNNQTADLLEALRRRRGEREAAQFGDETQQAGLPQKQSPQASPSNPSGSGIRIVDIPLDGYRDVPNAEAGSDEPQDDPRKTTAPQPFLPPQQKAPRKGRQSMPTWDEIVFGARSDDDLA